MDRLFLDANVLFSAAYRPDSRINELWTFSDVQLLTSEYAEDEARRNLLEHAQLERLNQLMESLDIVPSVVVPFPPGIELPAKDWPILQAAINCSASYLITGDSLHFGTLFGRTIAGVNILTPSQYLSGR